MITRVGFKHLSLSVVSSKPASHISSEVKSRCDRLVSAPTVISKMAATPSRSPGGSLKRKIADDDDFQREPPSRRRKLTSQTPDLNGSETDDARSTDTGEDFRADSLRSILPWPRHGSQLPSCDDWEECYEQAETSHRLIELMAAHVELRRRVKEKFHQIDRQEDVLDMLFAHRTRVEDKIEDLVERLRERAPHHPEIERLVEKLRRIQDMIDYRQFHRNNTVLDANSAADALSRHVSVVFPLFQEIDVEQSHSFKDFPLDFFDDLAECLYLHWRRNHLEEALKHHRQEHIVERDEILDATVAVFRARQDSGTKSSLLILENELHSLRTSDDLLDLKRVCSDAAIDLDELEPQLRQAEVRFYDTIEDQFVAKGMIDPATPQSYDEGGEALDDVLSAAEPQASPLHGPGSSANYEDDLRLELDRRLAVVLTERLNSAARMFDSYERRLEALEGPEDLDLGEMALAESEERYFLLAKRRHTRELADAQAEYESVVQEAQQAGVSAAPPKSSGFSSHASDGYAHSIVERHIALTKRDGLEEWIPDGTAFETPKKEHLTSGDAIAMLEPSEPEEKPDLDDIAVGESHSTVAVGKNKARIDSWLTVQKPRMLNEKDVFRPSGRRMSV